MEQITGRLTADAKVKTVKGDRQVVNFSVAVNDRYKKKGEQTRQNTRFFKCAYWASTAISPFLKKGGLVELAGRIDIQVWNNPEGNAKGTLSMHVNNIRLLGNTKGQEEKTESPAAQLEGTKDNLPF
jgi:single-strand DNA-binding protein